MKLTLISSNIHYVVTSSQSVNGSDGRNLFFSRLQGDEMEKLFQENNYPSFAEMKELAEGLKLLIHEVKSWFNHRREKLKKKSHMMETKSTQSPYGWFF